MKKLLLFFLAFVLFPSLIHAHRLEPIGTELPNVLEKGRLVTEVGFGFLGFDDRTTASTVVPVGIEFSFIQDLQLEVEFPYQDGPGAASGGIGDTEIGVRYQWLHEEDSFLNFSTGLEAKIPTGSEARGLGEGVTAGGPNLNIGRWFHDRFHLLGNVGYEISTKNGQGERSHELIARQALVTRLYEETFYLTEEVSYLPEFHQGTHSERHDHLLVAPGFLIAVRHGVEFKTSFPIGLASDDPDFSWRSQVAISFGEVAF
ncbi:MAG: transporter [Deltaproteobacteria bacterium]|nr:transporter [Deltaproteobacteria bacterium]